MSFRTREAGPRPTAVDVPEIDSDAAEDQVRDAVAVAQGAASAAHTAASVAGAVALDGKTDAIVQHAAAVVEEAAALVEEAAQVVQAKAASDAASLERDAARAWSGAERRRGPRKSHARSAAVDWKHLALYFSVLLGVTAVGVLTIWMFLERQSLVVAPAPLPAATVLTADPRSLQTAAWVRLLTRAELAVTVVPPDRFEPVRKGVLVICDAQALPPQVMESVARSIREGRGVLIAGAPPSLPLAGMTWTADLGASDDSMKLGETSSPLLARTGPGRPIRVSEAVVALLRESPRLQVDARWNGNARAAIAHFSEGSGRTVWFGFDPADPAGADPHLLLVVRNAFRWLDRQPISEGAVGAESEAGTISPAARAAAPEAGLAVSVDRIRDGRSFRITLLNRGAGTIEKPTVKIWLPPDVERPRAGGDPLMRRGMTVIDLPEERACLVVLDALSKGQRRVVKLTTTAREEGVAGEP